jgi:hypothetical protein
MLANDYYPTEMDGQWIDVDQLDDSTMRRLSLALLGFSGAVTAGLLTSFFFSGWVVATAALLGGVCGLSISAFCWVARNG